MIASPVASMQIWRRRAIVVVSIVVITCAAMAIWRARQMVYYRTAPTTAWIRRHHNLRNIFAVLHLYQVEHGHAPTCDDDIINDTYDWEWERLISPPMYSSTPYVVRFDLLGADGNPYIVVETGEVHAPTWSDERMQKTRTHLRADGTLMFEGEMTPEELEALDRIRSGSRD